MGNLRDQLKKAKIISKKEAKRLAHEERVHRTKVGREGLEKEEAAHTRDLADKREAGREEDRAQQAAVEAQKKARAELVACEKLIADESRAPAYGGRGAWFFELACGTMPFLELTEGDRMMLGGGNLAIVRTGPVGSHSYRLIAIEHATRIRACLPDRIVWASTGIAG